MDKAIVAKTQVSDVSALNELLTSLPFGDPKYHLLQRPDEITDWTKETPSTEVIEQFTHGRLFGNQGELRWQKTNNGYALLWLSEGKLPEGFIEQGDWVTCKSQNIYLLGGGDDPEPRDTRIPRKLRYPIQQSKFLCIKAIQYKESKSETIRFTRYTEFVPTTGD